MLKEAHQHCQQGSRLVIVLPWVMQSFGGYLTVSGKKTGNDLFNSSLSSPCSRSRFHRALRFTVSRFCEGSSRASRVRDVGGLLFVHVAHESLFSVRSNSFPVCFPRTALQTWFQSRAGHRSRVLHVTTPTTNSVAAMWRNPYDWTTIVSQLPHHAQVSMSLRLLY